MDVTNRFVLDFAMRFARERPGAAMLDYGCGAGEVVAAARAAGLDMWGADIYYGGSNARAEAERAGLLGAAIRPMQDFPPGSFDLVVNNQVLEHVEDLGATLDGIHRALKRGGTLLSVFPSRDVLREGHIGIPLAHWFPKGSRLRLLYAWSLRAIGFGYWKEQAPACRQWAVDKLNWIDAYTRYRSRREILAAFDARFRSEFREPDYIRYRLRQSPRLAPLSRLLSLPLAPAAATWIFRKLAFMVIVSHKENA
jgi:SAM-dependent methyltransferase